MSLVRLALQSVVSLRLVQRVQPMSLVLALPLVSLSAQRVLLWQWRFLTYDSTFGVAVSSARVVNFLRELTGDYCQKYVVNF